MTYDSKCYDLAEAFFEDEPELRTDYRVKELAGVIHLAIEEYFEDLKFKPKGE
jgi:hypothetical protein